MYGRVPTRHIPRPVVEKLRGRTTMDWAVGRRGGAGAARYLPGLASHRTCAVSCIRLWEHSESLRELNEGCGERCDGDLRCASDPKKLSARLRQADIEGPRLDVELRRRTSPFPNIAPTWTGLPAVAVLSVLAFHAFPSWVNGGFIGVITSRTCLAILSIER